MTIQIKFLFLWELLKTENVPLKLTPNDCGYDQCGIAELRLYPPTQNLPAGATACKPLKPALVMSRCWA